MTPTAAAMTNEPAPIGQMLLVGVSCCVFVLVAVLILHFARA